MVVHRWGGVGWGGGGVGVGWGGVGGICMVRGSRT